MAPLPYREAGAQIAFYLVFGVFVLLEWRIAVQSRLGGRDSGSDRGSVLVVWAAVAGGLTGAFVMAGGVHGAAIGAARWPIFVVGVALMVIGIVIRQWAVALLGRFFTIDVRVHTGQKVVDTGPYRWVRHPSYTGLLLTLLGVGLALGNWASLAVLITVPTVGLIVRIRVEERALLQGLGEPYRRFAATRARLIPGVW